MLNKQLGLLILFAFLFEMVGSCTSVNDQRLEAALQMAGENRGELEKVLKHYEHDTLKLKAARFLIENMPYHYGINDRLLDYAGKEYQMDLSIYRNEDEVKLAYDSLLQKGYHMERLLVKDSESLTAAALIENIDLAFVAKNKKWAKEIPFHLFCKYILPYRVSNEPLSEMRKEMMKRYMKVLDSIAPRTEQEACMALNNYLKKQIHFIGFSPFYNSIEYVDKYKRGNCEGLAVYFTFLARALGIPCCVESTLWSKFDAGHSWCALIDRNGKTYPFGAAELNFREFKKTFSRRIMVPAKIYRKEYEVFFSHVLADDGYVTYLKNPTLIDVTSFYERPSVKVEFDSTIFQLNETDNGRFLYLCVYNSGLWKEIALGRSVGRKVVFTNVVGDNVFRLAKSDDGKKLSFLTDPFLLDSLGDVKMFSQEGLKPIRLHKDRKEDKLMFWDSATKDFRLCKVISESDSTLLTLAPTHALFQTVSSNHTFGRLFIEQNGTFVAY